MASREMKEGIMADKSQAEREAEVDALIARAQDPEDEYDGHHGHDRTAGE